MASYLVTGGAGFIGSNIVEALVARGAQVRVLDDLSTGTVRNIAPWRDSVEFVQASLTDLPKVQEATRGVDYVLHQGALPSVPKSIAQPGETHAVNVTGTVNVLIAARDAGVKRVVYAASSSVYGDAPKLPKSEEMMPRPKSPYAAQSTRASSTVAYSWSPTACLRWPCGISTSRSAAGPQQPLLGRRAQVRDGDPRGKRPTIFGDGEQSRDFTYVDNVVSANLLACTADESCIGQSVNIACGERRNLKDSATRSTRRSEPTSSPSSMR